MIRTYKQITISENKKRLALLENFKLHLNIYLSNLQHATFGELYENVKAKEEHKEINKLIDDACSYIEAIPSIINNKYKKNSLSQNITVYEHNLTDRRYFYKSLVNMIERAIAIYKKDSKNAKWRTYFPLFWIILLIDYLFVDLFFEALDKISPNKEGIEFSLMGIIIRWILRVLSTILLTIIVSIAINYLRTAGYIPTS